ncbi:MAG: threonine--tRNA ligase [Atopobiaceae bacterium]|jgi:threonyl-tRNA synthetase|nr:threonine--tRNA ligase [Atopobiaceae bacterium]MCI2172901.1 threonine--tRNA ligase [Atopobiaceae bacterium]MCI2208306.1 threonine--tRNA ligase [Atopobiaceae bacterium]
MKVIYNDGHVDECPEDEELHVIRHTAAHIMAQAISRLYPDADFGYGPATDNGFYYDVDLGDRKLDDSDLEAIETEMRKIVKENEKITTFCLPRDEAIKLMEDRHEKYKVEHIGDLAEDARITFYQQGDYIDMCVGPHLCYTKGLKAFKVTGQSGAYWKGDKDNKMLTRINGIAFRTKDELEAHMKLLEEAAKRDHRKIGREMDLFMMRDEAPGFPFWLPNGMILKNELIDYWREIHTADGYVEISTPLIMNKQLWKTSGHWDHYKDNMYSTTIDDEEYCIKPMNCPGGVLVYASKPHSYRELPIRAGELGLVHRHELRGALHGLFRVRCFTQDDAHIFMRPDQITDEIMGVVHLIDSVYAKFGFKYHVELSTRPDNSMGSDEDWAAATDGLKAALDKLGMEYAINEGDGAFYGPKIDFHLEDSLGRTWQCGTIQLDFQMPLNFDLTYTDADGSKKRPIMIHRVIYGSIERFIGILIEHYAGKFPTWLAPCQVKVLPVSEKTLDYAKGVTAALKAAGIRATLDERDEKIGYKIREARSIDRVPYMLILGEKESEAGTISVRDRTNETTSRSLDDFIADITEEVSKRTSYIPE